MEIPDDAKRYINKYRASNGIVDFYRFLKIPRSSSLSEIRDAMAKKMTEPSPGFQDQFLKTQMLLLAAKVFLDEDKKKEYDFSINQVSIFTATFIILIDAILFFIIPTLFYSFAAQWNFLSEDTAHGLLLALATMFISSLSIFAFQGNYLDLDIHKKMSLFFPAFAATSVYWIVLVASEISDGYGRGNVTAVIFGLIISIAILWKRNLKYIRHDEK